MISKIRNTVIFSFVAMSAFGQATDDDLQLNTITTAVPFMSITPDSRAGAMGDAGTALSASSTSIYWNTSMLNFAEEKSAISISYTPWLRQLTNDIHLSYLSGYYKINDRHAIGGALRYFNLGEITFTDEQANVIREDKPNEFELTAGYAFRLSDKMSVGINGKFVYSNLTGGLPVAGVETKPGVAGATDISFTYSTDEAKIGSTRGTYNFAATINNVGNKIAYSSVSSGFRDFLPMNLKIGNAFVADFDAYNKVTFSVDLQKLLVPTPPTYEFIDGEVVRIAGRDNNVGVISGMLQSFYDAPGVVLTDEVSGDYLQNDDGTYQIKSGSRFIEELTEINLAAGVEWWYNDVFALRGGFFFESNNKGARQFFNLGAGFKYNKFGIDISYLAALQRNNPLANTLRFTLRMVLGESGSSSSTAPE
ncbi:MAG: type IX secretion system outer membrane channel protein PorV [Crocinitomicaceae bacterium]